MLGCFLIAILSLLSCNKEEFEVFDSPIHKLKTVSYYSDDQLRTTEYYEYDSKSRVSTYIRSITVSNDIFRSTYDYQTQALIVNSFRNDTLIGTETINLDSRGLRDDRRYVFDFEGNLIRFYNNIQNDDYVDQTWANGNIISGSYYYKSKLSHIIRYHYDLSKVNSLYINSPILGKRNKNLVSYYEYIKPGLLTPTKKYYEYKFDSSGRVLKEVMPGGSYYTFTYYD
jgi:hypothetical protein